MNHASVCSMRVAMYEHEARHHDLEHHQVLQQGIFASYLEHCKDPMIRRRYVVEWTPLACLAPAEFGKRAAANGCQGIIATPAALRPDHLNCTQQSKLGIETRSTLSNHVSDNMRNEHFYEIASLKSVWRPVLSSSLVPLKTRRVEELMHVQSVKGSKSSYRQCVEVWRKGCQISGLDFVT
ncbi:hypothetical protein TNCV_3663571 [Trichonephila clavipes]|nr:hypothetical protein TNCV_3663571 [Trichonephila clavipes]